MRAGEPRTSTRREEEEIRKVGLPGEFLRTTDGSDALVSMQIER